MRLDQCAVAPPLQDQEARLHQHPRRAGVSELARGLGSGTGWPSIQVTACMSMCGVSWSVRSARQREIRSAHTHVATAPAHPRRRVRSRSAPPYHLRPRCEEAWKDTASRAPYRRAYRGRASVRGTDARASCVLPAPRCSARCAWRERPQRCWSAPRECLRSA